MSKRVETFAIDGPPRLVVRIPAGDVRIVEGESGRVVVRCRAPEQYLSRLSIEGSGNTVSIGWQGGFGRGPSVDVEIAVGAPPDVRARFGSADLQVQTPAAAVEAVGASGDVKARTVAGNLTVHLASGDLEVEAVDGAVEAVAASGDVRLARVAGRAQVKTASGDVLLGEVSGDCILHSASGDLLVSRFEGNRFESKSISGDLRLGLPPGRRYSLSLRSLSGDVGTDFPLAGGAGGAPASITATSISGSIRLTEAWPS